MIFIITKESLFMAGPSFQELNQIAPDILTRSFLRYSKVLGSGNFALTVHYRGRTVSKKDAIKAMTQLVQRHQMLRVTKEVGLQFKELNKSELPIHEHFYCKPEGWKAVAKKELVVKFHHGEFLWKIVLCKQENGNDNQNAAVFVIDHAIADGKSLAKMVESFFHLVTESKVLDPESLPVTVKDLYSKYAECVARYAFEPFTPDRATPFSPSNFVFSEIGPDLMKRLVDCCHRTGVRMNSVLMAAFLKAIKTEMDLSFDDFNAISMVDLRPHFSLPVKEDLLRVLMTWIFSSIKVTNDFPTAEIAKILHEDLYKQLTAGNHVRDLPELEAFDKIAGDNDEEFLWLQRWTKEYVGISNEGVLDFCTEFPFLEVEKIYVTTNMEPYCPHKSNALLSVLTMKKKDGLHLFASVSYPANLSSEATWEKVLKKFVSNLELEFI